MRSGDFISHTATPVKKMEPETSNSAATIGRWEIRWENDVSRADIVAALDRARQFAELLPPNVQPPELSVHDDGDIAFDWDSTSRQVFSVRVTKDGTLYFAGLFGNDTIHGSDCLRGALPPPSTSRRRRSWRIIGCAQRTCCRDQRPRQWLLLLRRQAFPIVIPGR